MTKKQSTNILPPRISIFDKKGQATLSRIAKLPNMPHNPTRVNLPQVRITQNKGS